MPQLTNRNIKIAIDEWTGGGRGDFSRTLPAEGLMKCSATRTSSRWGVPAFPACLATDGADASYSSTGLIFYLYRHHFGTIPVAITGNAPQPEVKGTVGVDKPKVSSGSDTSPLDVAAAFTDDRKVLTIAVVNPTETDQKIKLTFDHIAVQGQATKREVAVKI
jgi:alpha-N-arabinofuranosidase